MRKLEWILIHSVPLPVVYNACSESEKIQKKKNNQTIPSIAWQLRNDGDGKGDSGRWYGDMDWWIHTVIQHVIHSQLYAMCHDKTSPKLFKTWLSRLQYHLFQRQMQAYICAINDNTDIQVSATSMVGHELPLLNTGYTLDQSAASVYKHRLTLDQSAASAASVYQH